MSLGKKLKDWVLERRGRAMVDYEETKKQLERVLGTPTITVTLELREDLLEMKRAFLSLEKDEEFLEAVRELAESYLEGKKASARQ